MNVFSQGPGDQLQLAFAVDELIEANEHLDA
jgi:hypothetical protein